MELTLNVDVECPEGKLGRATYLIVNPVSDEATHLVVRDDRFPHEERLLPIAWVKESTHDGIDVDCTMAVWSKQDLFYETEFISVEMPQYDSTSFGWPYLEATPYVEEYQLGIRN